MIDLNKKVFGNITNKEIIGEFPPIQPDFENMLKEEFVKLTHNLGQKHKEDLKKILEEQKLLEKQVNNRPGAMALSQNKIELFVKYCSKYIAAINAKIDSI